MGIDTKIEQATRQMLGHAMRHELEELASLIHGVGDETYRAVTGLCAFASAYIAIDVSGMQWPSDVMLRRIAFHAAEPRTRPTISQDEIFEFLCGAAFGNEKLDDLFTAEGISLIPLYATAGMLLAFCPGDREWTDYLDQIREAAEAADRVSLAVLPALMLRARGSAAQPAS